MINSVVQREKKGTRRGSNPGLIPIRDGVRFVRLDRLRFGVVVSADALPCDCVTAPVAG